MAKLMKSKISLIVLSFIVGGALTYFTFKNQNHNGDDSFIKTARARMVDKDQQLASDPFVEMERMQKMMRERMEKMMEDSMTMDMTAGSRFSFGGSSPSVEEKEDDKYKYLLLDTTNLDKKSLKIDIQDGYIKISGETKQVTKSKKSGMQASSTFVSSFSNQFPVPYGVDESGVKIEQNDKNIIIRFPKNDA